MGSYRLLPLLLFTRVCGHMHTFFINLWLIITLSRIYLWLGVFVFFLFFFLFALFEINHFQSNQVYDFSTNKKLLLKSGILQKNIFVCLFSWQNQINIKSRWSEEQNPETTGVRFFTDSFLTSTPVTSSWLWYALVSSVFCGCSSWTSADCCLLWRSASLILLFSARRLALNSASFFSIDAKRKNSNRLPSKRHQSRKAMKNIKLWNTIRLCHININLIYVLKSIYYRSKAIKTNYRRLCLHLRFTDQFCRKKHLGVVKKQFAAYRLPLQHR